MVFKSFLVVCVAFGISNLFSATAPLDPDTYVLNAINPLCTDAAINALDLTGATALKDLINAAIVMYKTPDASQLATVQGYLTKVQARIDSLNVVVANQTAAKATLDAAVAATDFATLIAKLNDSNMTAQFAWLKTNYASTVASLNAKIIAWDKALLTQTATSVGAYLDNLKTLSNAIKTNTTVFNTTDQASIISFADSVNSNADAAKNITAILGANLSTVNGLATILGNTTNVAAARAWRTIVSKMPQ